MKRKFVLVIGFIVFVAFVWVITTIGLKSSYKKVDKPIIFICQNNDIAN